MNFTAAHLALGFDELGLKSAPTPKIKVPKLVRQHNTLDWYSHLFIHGYTQLPLGITESLIPGALALPNPNFVSGFLAIDDGTITFLKDSHVSASTERVDVRFSKGTLILWDHRTKYELPTSSVAPVRFTIADLHALYTDKSKGLELRNGNYSTPELAGDHTSTL